MRRDLDRFKNGTSVVVLLHDGFTWIQPEQYRELVEELRESQIVVIPVSVKGLVK